MDIRIGYDIVYNCTQETPMVLMLNVHPDREKDLIRRDVITTSPVTQLSSYLDMFGNRCTRIVAPPGPISITTDAIIRDPGVPDPASPDAREIPVKDLPDEALIYLVGSRYCETDRLMGDAWYLFGQTQPGWSRVQAIVSFVNKHIQFGYHYARNTRTANEGFHERVGVCRDYAHLAVAFCRCMNIPARYATGYLGDIGVPIDVNPMDFSAWFEVYLDGRWHTFDARHDKPRIGRIVMARGRDAADVALTTSFGNAQLMKFQIWTDEIKDGEDRASVAA